MHRSPPKWLWITGIVRILAALAQPWLQRGAGISATTTIVVAFVVAVAWIVLDLLLSKSAN